MANRSRFKYHKIWNEHNPSDKIQPNDGYSIHHINEDYLDNRIENLQKMTNSEHIRLHHKGVKKSKEHVEKVAKANRGKVRSEETKKNISDSLKGRKLPREQKQKISNTLKSLDKDNPNMKTRFKKGVSTPKSEETRKKMSEAGKGRKFTKEHKENIRKAALKRHRNKNEN